MPITHYAEVVHIKYLYQYSHPQIRDLAWVISSPGLLDKAWPCASIVDDEWCQSSRARCEAKLRVLDDNPAPLEQWLAQRRSRRLGVYFESLIGYWLSELLGAEMFLQNTPVYSASAGTPGRRTLGEFDFLFRLPGENFSRHWEAAVKLYLRYEMSEQPVKWIGPASKDRLDIKLNRIVDHQLALGRSPQGMALLDNLGLSQAQAAVLMKGYLFYPFSQSADMVTEDHLSATHLRGWWLTVTSLLHSHQPEGEHWVILPRQRWLAPFSSMNDSQREGSSVEVVTRKDLREICQQHFVYSSDALLVASVTRVAGHWQEIQRGFVVHDDWPNCI